MSVETRLESSDPSSWKCSTIRARSSLGSAILLLKSVRSKTPASCFGFLRGDCRQGVVQRLALERLVGIADVAPCLASRDLKDVEGRVTGHLLGSGDVAELLE